MFYIESSRCPWEERFDDFQDEVERSAASDGELDETGDARHLRSVVTRVLRMMQQQ